jgi:hypothetical protein
MSAREHDPSEPQFNRNRRNLKSHHYWYMTRFVVGGACLGYILGGSIAVIVVPAFFFLLYVIDDLFGAFAACIFAVLVCLVANALL